MKKTKRQRKAKVPSRPLVTPRPWSKKTTRILKKQFDRYVYEELYVPVQTAWGAEIVKYEKNMFDDARHFTPPPSGRTCEI